MAGGALPRRQGVSARNAERWTGRTDTNFVVHFPPTPRLRSGDLVKVELERSNVVSLVGRIVE